MKKVSPGIHQVVWHGNNETGKKVASGVYFYRMEAAPSATKKVEFTQVQKMILLK
jgi:flagellar hook assembly protein FlgD